MILKQLVGWLLLVGSLMAVGRAAEVQLPVVGRLGLSAGWRVVERTTNAMHRPFHYFVILQNEATPGLSNDLLSFHIRADYGDRDTNTIHFADTAHEVFPDGRNWWTRPNTNALEVHNLRLHVGPMDGGYETLQYSFVTERPEPAGPLMAHGYVLFGNATVFVQHTSARPISRDVIDGVAFSLMNQMVKTSAPNHLRKSGGLVKDYP